MDSRTLVAELERRCAPAAGLRWVGIENEYTVVAGGEVVDFRRIVGSLPGGVRGLDPGDINAVRLSWGGVLTADGREAEIATPPRQATPGFAVQLALMVARGATGLRAQVAPARLDGYSTHISIEVPDRAAVATGRRFVRSYALPMMLLLDRASSPGLLVRPRRGRLELCGDHVAGNQLVAATVFALAASLDCGSGWGSECGRRSVGSPPPRVERAVERFGWYIDRNAFGPDLYTGGRLTLLPGGSRAQAVMERSWARLRPLVEGHCDEGELAVLDSVVGGVLPLPCELDEPVASAGTWPRAIAAGQGAFAGVVRTRRIGALVVEPRVVTWAVVVLAVRRGADEILVSVPGRRLDAFLRRLDAGELDDVLLASVDARGRLGTLRPRRRTERLGVHDRVDDAARLVPGERDALTGRAGGPGSGGRDQKGRSDERPRFRGSRRPGRKLVAGGVVVVLALISAVAAVALADRRSGDDEAARDPSASPVSPTAFSPEQSAELSGTYDLVTTVIDGNASFPVGTEATAEFTLSAECRGGECRIEGDRGLGRATRAGSSLRFSSTTTEPCPEDPSISIQDSNDLVLRPAGPGRLTGELEVVSFDLAGCPNVGSDPVVYRWDARRR